MRCPNCNHEVKEGMLFCQQCGTKIEAVRTPEEAVRTPTEAVRTPEEAVRTPTEAVATPQAVNGQEGTIPTEKVQKSPVKNAPVEGGTFGWAVLGFLLFPIGLILFFIWRREYPKRAKSSGKGAFLGLVLLLLLYIGNIAMQYFIYQSFFNY